MPLPQSRCLMMSLGLGRLFLETLHADARKPAVNMSSMGMTDAFQTALARQEMDHLGIK